VGIVRGQRRLGDHGSRAGGRRARRWTRPIGILGAVGKRNTRDEPKGTGAALSFGARLRSLRQAAGLTQEELASQASLSPNAVSALERGARRRPHPHTVRSLADALGLPEEERAALVTSVPKRNGAASPAEREESARTTSSTDALPHPATPLVGRGRELEEVRGLIARPDVRLVTLTGIGGVGKSRLALEAARGIQTSFPDGAAFVGLAPLTDPALVLPTIVRTLGLREGEARSPGETLRAYLGERGFLLVLDNLEHLLEAASEVAALIEACPGVVVLATSRAPVRVRGEREYPVTPLALPPSSRSPAEEVAGSPSGRLFLDRARGVYPDFKITEGNAAAVTAICRRLAGLPLALELAASKVRLLDPSALLSRLDEALSTAWARDLPERQRTMRAALDWSHGLLSEPQQTLLRRLSVFVGGFSLEAAEAVGASDGDAAGEVLGPLGGLVEQSLVTADPDPAGDRVRYGMLEPVRQYARELLEGSGEGELGRLLHAGYYLPLAERAGRELKGPNQAHWLYLLEGENPNLRAALVWTTQSGKGELAIRIATSLRRFWSVRGHLEEGRRWLEAALASCPAPNPSLHAKALRGLGQMTLEQGEAGLAQGHFTESAALARSCGDKAGVAASLRGLAEAALWTGDHERAALLCEESVALRREAGDRHGLAMALNASGLVEVQRGDHERARALLEEGLAVAREAGDAWAVAVNLDNLGWASLGRDDQERAQRSFGESLRLYHELGEKWLAADCLDGLARVAATRGNPARAAWLWGAAEALSESIGATTAPLDQGTYERHLVATRAQLGDVAFEAAWEEGRAMAPEAAVAEALIPGK
jgi:predicted ATPase/DNA-binding XRE family transcriptional regulator